MTLPRLFLLTALLYAVAGMALGIQMGIAHDFTAVPVHAHINLVGWATLALFGLIHRAYPAMAASRLAWPQFWLAETGALTLVIGIALRLYLDFEPVVIVGSLLTVAATLLFVAMAISGVRDD